jgi:hypothetical protein
VVRARNPTTDGPGTFDSGHGCVVGYDMIIAASSAADEAAGIGPEDIRVAERHHRCTTNEPGSHQPLGLNAPRALRRSSSATGPTPTAAPGSPGPWTPRDLRRVPAQRQGWEVEPAVRDTRRMVDESAREWAIYQALKAADEVAAALQAHLLEEHGGDLDKDAARSNSTDSFTLLRQARERLGAGLRAVEADAVAKTDEISLRSDG